MFSCVVRGFKIVLKLTLMSVEVNHAGIYVSPRGAHGPDERRQVLMHVRDGQGLSVHRPRLHGHHKSDRVHQAALVKCQQLMNDVGNLNVGDLHDRRW